MVEHGLLQFKVTSVCYISFDTCVCVCVYLGVVWVPQHNPSPAALTANHSGSHAAGAYTNRLCSAQASVVWLKPAYTGFYLSWRSDIIMLIEFKSFM